jgi:VCBS repeat-containing protein
MRNRRIAVAAVRLVCVVGLLIANIGAGIFIPSASTPSAQAQSASAQRAEALVLVNSNSANYTDFQRYLQPYLNHFGVPYSVLDIATSAVGTTVADYAVILIGHRQLDISQAYLSSAEQTNLVNAVNGGTGLVNFDNDLSANGSTARYAYISSIFGFGYTTPPSTSGITFSSVAHYITERHAASEAISTGSMTLAGITLPPSATALATSGTQPFLAVATSGAGRAVQWGTTNWMSHAVKGPVYGLDDLVWRSIVWAARKPFVMQGMPPFVTMRIDDVTGPMDWVHIANEVGIKPWVGIFLNDMSAAESTDLASLSQAGLATIGIHAFSDPVSFYYNQYNGNYSDAVMAANYVTGTQWFSTYGITPSTYVAFHHYEVGSNAFSGLDNWGVKFVTTHQPPGQPEWYPTNVEWLRLGPYRIYESGLSTSTRPVYYADYLPIPGHPEYNQRFFNCVTEVRDEQVYEWIPTNDVAASVLHGTRQLQRALDGMNVPTLFAHQYNMVNITNANWRSIMQGIASNIAPYQPQYVTMDYACQYARAMYTSSISGSTYDSGAQQITTAFSGTTDMPTKFYLFTDNSGQIQYQLVNVPTFNGTTQVVTTVGSDTTPPSVTAAAPPNGSVNVSVSTNVTASFGEAINAATINTGTFELRDAANAIVPASVTYNGTSFVATLTPTASLASSSTYTATVKGGSNGVKDLAGNALSSNYVWKFTTGTGSTPSNCPCSIWNLSATPATPNVNDGQPIEVGVKFRSDVDGYITAVRFYKGSLNTGTHVGKLWTSTGLQLASVTFTGETASGWQTAALDAPVQILANTTYVASYFSPSGYFAEQANGLASSVDSPPLHALANGADGPNGVYRFGSTGFPTSGSGYNYWVDVIFNTAVGPDNTPPTVVAVTPLSGAVEVSVPTNVTARFSEAISATTISTSTFLVRNAANAIVPATVTYDAASRIATLAPAQVFANSSTYTATVKGGSTGVKDLAGNALASDHVWAFTTAAPPAPPPSDGPGGPVMVIANAANPFGRYYGEILRAEGFNAYSVTDISRVNATNLASQDVVILGEMTLTPAQVTMFSDWVNAGGNLIAMRPDKQLANLLGLTDAGSTLANAYLQFNPAQAAATGLVTQTIQYHGTADRYNLNGAVAVATLYSSATTSTANPAVTLRNVGSNGGQAAAFTYDLARSVVYTRQGNPAWAGQNRDGDTLVRSDDLFYGNASYDPQPDWIDFNKVAIPQADEQQRLLGHLIIQMNLDRKPLPHFWYFPHGKKAVVVMTGDDHASNGTAGRFDQYLTVSPAGCSVADWECIRSTSYVYPNAGFTDAQAASYAAQGFEVALHVTTDCGNYTQTSLNNFYTTQLNQFASTYPGVPAPATNRTHCVAWSDWASQVRVAISHSIRLDTNYYAYPGAWVGDRPGLFTGSGLIMRFADVDGSLLDVYQAPTQMTDESGQTYPFTIDTLLDRAIGPEGYYGAFTANIHTDIAAHPYSDAVINSARARGVPVVSARQMLRWLDGRSASAFTNLAWNGTALSFGITQGANTNGLQAMLPFNSASGTLIGLTRNSTAVVYTTQTIKGVAYAVFTATAGDYTATYAVDNIPPTVTSVTPAASATSVPTNTVVTAAFSEPIDPATVSSTNLVLRDATGAGIPAIVTYDPSTRTARLTPAANLSYGTAYTATVRGGATGVKDVVGNALAGDFVWSFTTQSAPTPNTCPCSIWNDTVVPAFPAVSDGQPIEVGVKFRSDVNGYITGLRFYKGAANTGTHVGHLWSSSGTQLAAATFSNETASGWQTVSFAAPVAINANTTYIASYHSSSGYFAYDAGYFSTGVNNPPLRALAAGVDGVNGVYQYGASAFPTSGSNANYWVDVVFTTTVATDTTPPTVTSVSPASNVVGVNTSSNVSVTFSEPVDAATINSSTIELRDPANVLVPAAVTYNAGANTASLTPAAALSYSTSYTATVKGGAAGVKDAAGNALASNFVWSFTTMAPPACPCSIWNDTVVPAFPAVSDGQPIEVGVKFRSDVNGYITGLRFYKGAANTGTHVGHLWSSSGTQLAAATFSNETASGWQTVSFAAPVAINANTTYIASYHSSSGYFAYDAGYFSTGVNNPPLRALAAGVDGVNGVYQYGASAFPTSGSNANYWVDVVFTTTAPGNQAPTANGDSYNTAEDSVLNIAAAQGVLSNDSDPDGNPLTAVKISDPAHGTVTLNANGSFVYTPALNYNGADSFTYAASDGTSNSNTATVTITIAPVNDPPVANSQTVNTTVNTPVAVTLSAADIDGNPLSYNIVSGPTRGALSGAAPNLTYTPNTGLSGTDTFTFNASDGTSNSNTATVTITVGAPAPALSAIGPNTVVAGDPAITLIVTGTGFINGSIVRWNGSDRTTTFVSSTRLSANIPASDLASAGSINVTVFNPAPGGGTSNALTFTVAANRLANGRFETDANADGRPDSWTSSSRFTRSSTATHGGSYSGRHFATNNPSYNIQQLVTGLSGGTTYQFAGWTNIPGTSDAFTYRLLILWRNSAGSTLRTDTIRTYTASTGGAWNQATASLVAPTGTASAYVRMEVTSLNATIYADDFTLRSVP